jgi:hypothetical protein
VIYCRFGPDALFYRAVTPRGSFQPESGAGWETVGTRSSIFGRARRAEVILCSVRAFVNPTWVSISKFTWSMCHSAYAA